MSTLGKIIPSEHYKLIPERSDVSTGQFVVSVNSLVNSGKICPVYRLADYQDFKKSEVYQKYKDHVYMSSFMLNRYVEYLRCLGFVNLDDILTELSEFTKVIESGVLGSSFIWNNDQVFGNSPISGDINACIRDITDYTLRLLMENARRAPENQDGWAMASIRFDPDKGLKWKSTFARGGAIHNTLEDEGIPIDNSYKFRIPIDRADIVGLMSVMIENYAHYAFNHNTQINMKWSILPLNQPTQCGKTMDIIVSESQYLPFFVNIYLKDILILLLKENIGTEMDKRNCKMLTPERYWDILHNRDRYSSDEFSEASKGKLEFVHQTVNIPIELRDPLDDAAKTFFNLEGIPMTFRDDGLDSTISVITDYDRKYNIPNLPDLQGSHALMYLFVENLKRNNPHLWNKWYCFYYQHFVETFKLFKDNPEYYQLVGVNYFANRYRTFMIMVEECYYHVDLEITPNGPIFVKENQPEEIAYLHGILANQK